MTADTRLQEALFTGLRLTDGVSLRTGQDEATASTSWSRYGEALQPFVDGGWLSYDGGALRLTRDGHAGGARHHDGVRGVAGLNHGGMASGSVR